MSRTLWRPRRAADSPRPAGRRWTGGLRRSGVLARRVLRVRRRRDRAFTVETYPSPHIPHPARPVPAPPRAGGAPVAPGRPPGTADPGEDADLLAQHGTQPGEQAAALTGYVDGAAGEPTTLLPGTRTFARRVSFLLVNLCTVASLTLGVLAILLAMRGDVQLAALCLLSCVACDGMDGMLARRLGVSSPFGAQMDSLADMCAFGVAAPVVLYASFAGEVAREAAALACALLAVCAAIRLARFNVVCQHGRYFAGVPTTAAAAVLALSVLVDLPLAANAQLVGLGLLALAMVSSFPYASVARLVRLPAWLWLAPLAGVFLNPQLTFVTLVAAYLASGPGLWLHQRRTA